MIAMFECMRNGKRIQISQPSKVGAIILSYMTIKDYLKLKLYSKFMRNRIELSFENVDEDKYGV